MAAKAETIRHLFDSGLPTKTVPTEVLNLIVGTGRL